MNQAAFTNSNSSSPARRGDDDDNMMGARAVNITYKTNPPLMSADLNALFSAGREAPETSDWQPVLAHSLVYLCAYDGERLIGFANVAWDGRVHSFLLDPRVHPDWRHRGIGTKLVALAAEV